MIAPFHSQHLDRSFTDHICPGSQDLGHRSPPTPAIYKHLNIQGNIDKCRKEIALAGFCKSGAFWPKPSATNNSAMIANESPKPTRYMRPSMPHLCNKRCHSFRRLETGEVPPPNVRRPNSMSRNARQSFYRSLPLGPIAGAKTRLHFACRRHPQLA
jgi:hypothetical protein